MSSNLLAGTNARIRVLLIAAGLVSLIMAAACGGGSDNLQSDASRGVEFGWLPEGAFLTLADPSPANGGVLLMIQRPRTVAYVHVYDGDADDLKLYRQSTDLVGPLAFHRLGRSEDYLQAIAELDQRIVNIRDTRRTSSTEF